MDVGHQKADIGNPLPGKSEAVDVKIKGCDSASVTGKGTRQYFTFTTACIQYRMKGDGGDHMAYRFYKTPVRIAGNQTPIDRKSTRLNSSHQLISYAVFC